MDKQTLLNLGDEISALNHAIEKSKLDTLAFQGELLTRAANWAKGAGVPAMTFAMSLKRIRMGIEATEEDLKRAGIVHADMQKRFEETMDLPFGCPEAELEVEKVAHLNAVG